jgi:hypothetical protein
MISKFSDEAPRAREVEMRFKTLGILLVVLVASIMALALPAHFSPRAGGDVGVLKVTIHEWDVPT